MNINLFTKNNSYPILPPPTPPKETAQKKTPKKTKTNNSWVYITFPMNMHLHRINTLYLIFQSTHNPAAK